MLILRPDLDAEAPVVICDWPGCPWRLPIVVHPGEPWAAAVDASIDALEQHVLWEHEPPAAKPRWDVEITWADEATLRGSGMPPPPEGDSWEPFASFAHRRGGVPGFAVVWRRPSEPDEGGVRVLS